MQINLRSLIKGAVSLAFVGAMVLSFTIGANAQGHDRHGWRDMRGYENRQRHDFRHEQRDLRRYNGGNYNGYYPGYGYRQYNNRGYYDPYYNRGYYNRGYYGRYYRPHIDSRNGFKRTIHHLLGGTNEVTLT